MNQVEKSVGDRIKEIRAYTSNSNPMESPTVSKGSRNLERSQTSSSETDTARLERSRWKASIEHSSFS